jgi:ubiquinone biosynthesis protein
VQLEHGGLDELLGKVDVLANRLVFALVTGALLLGSCMLGALNKGGPGVPYLGVQVVSFIGFTLALIMGSILLAIIFRSRRL